MNPSLVNTSQYVYGGGSYQYQNNSFNPNSISLNLNPSELTYYRSLYTSIPGREMSGDLPAKNVVDFLKTSNLSKDKLKTFWRCLKKPDNNPSVKVSQQELFILLKMISLDQMNIDPNVQNIVNPIYQNLPIFHNVEEEDAFETFQVATHQPNEDFTDFEHSSPLKLKDQMDRFSPSKFQEKTAKIDDLIEFQESHRDKEEDINDNKNIIAANYDKYDVFDEILHEKKSPPKHENIENKPNLQENEDFSEFSQGFQLPPNIQTNTQDLHKNLQNNPSNSQKNQPDPPNNTQNSSDFNNPFSPDFHNQIEKTQQEKAYKLENFMLEKVENQKEEEFEDFQDFQQSFPQKSQRNVQNTQTKDTNLDEFNDYQGLSNRIITNNKENKEISNEVDDDPFKEISEISQKVQKLQGISKEEEKKEVKEKDIDLFEGFSEKSPEIHKIHDNTNIRNSQEFQNVTAQETKGNMNQLTEINAEIQKKSSEEFEDFQEFQQIPNKNDNINLENQLNVDNNQVTLKKNEEIIQNKDIFNDKNDLFPQKSNVFEIDWPEAEQSNNENPSDPQKTDDFVWGTTQTDNKPENPPLNLPTKKSEDLMDFDSDDVAQEQPDIKAILEGKGSLDPTPNQQNDIKALLEGSKEVENNENNTENTLNFNRNDLFTSNIPTNGNDFQFNIFPNNKSFAFNFNEIANNEKHTTEEDFEWNEAPAMKDSSPEKITNNNTPDCKESPSKSPNLQHVPSSTNEINDDLFNKQPNITSKYDLNELFEQNIQENTKNPRNLLDLISYAENLLPNVGISNFFGFSGTLEEITELEKGLFNLELYEESEKLSEYIRIFNEITQQENKKKQLIAEERYEEVIEIRDKVKELEKILMAKEKLQDFLDIYENAHGRSFTAECIDKLACLNNAEQLIEIFIGFIQKSKELGKDVKKLKEIKLEKNAFV